MRLIIKVVDVKGECPVYQVGDKIVLQNGYMLDPKATDTVCMHSLASILPFYVALSKGVKAKDIGLAKSGSNEAYVQCPDPCGLTDGGTVSFEISRVD